MCEKNAILNFLKHFICQNIVKRGINKLKLARRDAETHDVTFCESFTWDVYVKCELMTPGQKQWFRVLKVLHFIRFLSQTPILLRGSCCVEFDGSIILTHRDGLFKNNNKKSSFCSTEERKSYTSETA